MAGELSHGDLFAAIVNFNNPNPHSHPVDSVHFTGSWSAVPEPSSLLLFGSGLLLLVLIVSRKQLLHGREISA
jgi:hypothetical protein